MAYTEATKLLDTAGVNQGTIKAASTAPIAADTALVVALSPNTGTKISDGTTPTIQTAVKAASTNPVAADPAVVMTLSPNVSTLATALAKAEDNAHSSGDVGVMALGVRADTNTVATSATGDYSQITVDQFGNSRVVGDIANNTADTATSFPVKIGGVFNAALSTLASGFRGDAQMDSKGRLWTAIAASDLSVTATAIAGALATLTLPAAGAGLFHYITSIEISCYTTLARVGGAAPVIVTSTNLPGGPSWDFSSAGAVGTTERINFAYDSPIKCSSSVAATTIVGPATASVIWKIKATYYIAG
jgi:hypothetical protein